MAKPYIDSENVFSVWKRTKKKIDELTEVFPEYQRIARNQPRDDADPDYPNVTDGTSASIIQKSPKRVVQQLPTGVIDNDGDDEWLSIVAQDILDNRIIPNANEDYSLFEKCQLTIENGLTYGYSLVYAPFLNHDGELTPDYVIPYWGDVYPQTGRKSIKSAKYIFIRDWWQEEDIDYIIAEEEDRAKQAKKDKLDHEPTWNVKNLKEVKLKATAKDEQGTTPSESDAGGETSAIQIVTCFQVGVNAPIITFNPEAQLIIRTKKNKDPRGKMPLSVYYGDIDGTNPLGRSIIELIGPLQNLIDSDMQAYQYNRALALQPPLQNYSKSDVTMAPGAVIDMSDDPQGKVVPLTIDTSAIVNYPSLYGLQKSQILNLVPSDDTSISSEVGNPGFSKTPAGVNAQKASISVDDNAIRKAWEPAFADWAENAVNIYFAERSGKEIYTLTDDNATQIRRLVKDGKLPAEFISPDNKIIIDYDSATPALHFHVDASSSKLADDQTKLQALTLLQQTIDASPMISQLLAQFPNKAREIYNAIVGLSGVEDPEKLIISDDDQAELEQKQAEQAQMQQAQDQAAAEQAQQRQTPQLTPEEGQTLQQLQQLGYPDEAIQQVAQLFAQGASNQEVLQSLGIGA